MLFSSVIGLTGSFGSGCGTIADYLCNSNLFESFSLADRIRNEAKNLDIDKPKRNDLQNIGDNLRKEFGGNYLAKFTIDIILNREKNYLPSFFSQKIVIRSIRNPAEIQEIRHSFSNFILIGVDAPVDIRWERMKSKEKYTSRFDFEVYDKRDSGEDQPEYGQQVRSCMDNADIIITNDMDKNKLYNKVQHYLKLIEHPGEFQPALNEHGMIDAYVQSSNSTCMNRKVGAVIKEGKNIISSGYNGAPENITDCKSRGLCNRKVVPRCKKCNVPLQITLNKCMNCKSITEGSIFESLEKKLDLCLGIHAEERAILGLLKARTENYGCLTLYTTTFPCLLCAKLIVEIKLKEVVYVEPYPYRDSVEILQRAGVSTTRFEGVTKKAFQKLYIET